MIMIYLLTIFETIYGDLYNKYYFYDIKYSDKSYMVHHDRIIFLGKNVNNYIELFYN